MSSLLLLFCKILRVEVIPPMLGIRAPVTPSRLAVAVISLFEIESNTTGSCPLWLAKAESVAKTTAQHKVQSRDLARVGGLPGHRTFIPTAITSRVACVLNTSDHFSVSPSGTTVFCEAYRSATVY